MMNKDKYVQAMDNITMPEELRESILAQSKTAGKSRKKKNWKIAAIAAACLTVAFAVAIIPLTATLGASKSAADKMTKESYSEYSNETADEVSLGTQDAAAPAVTETTAASARKIVKNAEVYVETKDMKTFMKAVNQKLDTLGGYTESLQENNYDNMSIQMTARVPAEKLDEFLQTLETVGTAQSKNVSKSDVTDAYADTEGHITALETEEKALLKILEKCETVEDAMSVQKRLAEVRGELNGYRAQKKNYDSQIAYSIVRMEVSEAERIVRHDDSFSAQIKEKFEDSLYNIGGFFESLAVNLFGGILYVLLLAAAVVVVILIIRRVRTKRSGR